ncbi:MAG TPA: tRNA (adenosine(37)-N6)-threonylcarbamoyltransferase complex transferase subunit TsaD [Candidatus Paceibacterota bacterium]
MNILSIETSCDETGISVVRQENDSPEIALLGNALASQIELHAQYGGVFPAMAKRAHAEKIIPLTIEALKQAGLLIESTSTLGTDTRAEIESLCVREAEMIEVLVEFFNVWQKPDIDYIAVTVGPGLEPALWVGINTARVLGSIWNIPIIPINHMEGHVITAALEEVQEASTQKDRPSENSEKRVYVLKELHFPVLSLLVSGGHTELVLAHGFGQYEKIGQTRDDAVGEAFDKVARMLGLPYPGGPAVSKLAASFRAKEIENPFVLPRPMLHSGDYDFSYSGIKTAALYTVRDLTAQNTRELTEDEKMAIAAAFEDAAIEVLVKKTLRAAEEYGVQTVIVGGGVAGNTYLRQELRRTVLLSAPGTAVLFPESWLATDNAVMIAMAAVARIQAGNMTTELPEHLKAQGNLSIATQ